MPSAEEGAKRFQRDDPALDAKVAFLSRPDGYPEPSADVTRIETHLSWVFLTDDRAYKLKKPVVTAYVDLRDLSARYRNCAEEVRLNRRLSRGVYLGTVPLRRDAAGSPTFAADGEVIDWLVKMRRLPADRMLDRLIVEDSAMRADVDAVVELLCDFYRNSSPAELTPPRYRQEFAAGIAEYRAVLGRPRHALPGALLEQVCDRQLRMLSRTALFDERVRAGRVVEGHGDLRPEHICLEARPQIIDCLEFSRRLRTLDAVDELGYLALECERLGAPALGRQILDAYRERSGDAAPEALVHFYQSYRACVRAMLAILHLAEPSHADPAKWRGRAKLYLDLAGDHVARCG
jgi:aminoglycoside phosphotransferase family enzyme